MGSCIYIAGGYGLIGSTVARHIRKSYHDLDLILAGRHPEKGQTLAEELGRTQTARLDVHKPNEITISEEVDLIIAATKDPADSLIQLAMERSIAHIGISKLVDDAVPVLFSGLKTPPRRPVVLLGHWQAGVVTVIALKMAKQFDRLDTIAFAALYDELDPIGDMVAEEMAGFEGRQLLRKDWEWIRVDPEQNPRQIHTTDGLVLDGYPLGALDVPSLASITGARNVRFDIVEGQSIGTRAGTQASHDVYIVMEGVLHSGERATLQTLVTDPDGSANFTAKGILVAAEHVLGLEGTPAAAGGLHLPETLISPDAAIKRFEQLGIQITTSTL